ncbi:MAG: helix-turn-helix domain-containing protein [Clostridia bacterium]|nr:helix-turn-helix domain-containing protein [Clostridia bacterium]
MESTIGKNIARLRRERGMTQEELAAEIGLSFQAVSRWENGQTTPDVATLMRIAQLMHVSLDALAGYTHIPRAVSPYQEWYKSPEYYWGTEPSSLCLKIIELLPPVRPYRVLDIGCGEGKDAVFLARCGYDVTAFDIAQAGIDKARRLADKAGVYIDAFTADVCDYRLARTYDILHCSGVLHYIPPHLRAEIFANYREHTAEGGLHAMNVFVQKPFIAPPPEKEDSFDWHTGELFAHYRDWKLERMEERIFDCNSSGVPHQHAMDVVVARKMAQTDEDGRTTK